MIMKHMRIIVGDAGFEPEVWCAAKNEPPHLEQICIVSESLFSILLSKKNCHRKTKKTGSEMRQDMWPYFRNAYSACFFMLTVLSVLS